MDIASPVRDSDQKRNGLCLKDNSENQNYELKTEDIDIGSTEPRSAGLDNVDSDKLIASIENDENVRSKSGNVDMKHGAGNNSNRLAHSGKKVYPKLRGRRYLLRSSRDGVRVLRSMSKEKSMALIESASTPVNPVTEKKRKGRQVKKSSNDEFFRTRQRLRYLLTRINYEQNLLNAYYGEGWKGQSLEKIRPEKELERAKSEILRCKLKIRDLFRHLDSSLSEGRLQESLFDAEGEICSEDIVCAKCGLKDLSIDNDIILCDGTCNRGFHQKCLSPPLLSEDIPPGDEGWLCPACDCKVDCIDFLNEFQECDLSIEDMWEKVFPEVAIIGNADKQFDDLGLPSDDSEDDDYNPGAPQVDVENQKEGSSSGESDFTSSSEDSDSRASNRDMHYDTLGLPSDDSEDDDYDPDGPDLDEKVQQDGSSSDESDFTSDSDEFLEELNKTSDAKEASASSLSNPKPLDHSDEVRRVKDRNNSSINSELLFILEPDMNEENASPVSGKRQRDRLDYKKLYDETYGEASSDSSDDDDWCSTSRPKKGKKDDIGEDSFVLTKENTPTTIHRSSRSSKAELIEVNTTTKAVLDQLQVSQVVNENTSKGTHQKLDSSTANHPEAEQHSDSQEPDSNGNKASTSAWKSLGRMVPQTLLESFKENQYPTHETKESLSEELEITLQQVSKWFENGRHDARAACKEASQAGFSTPDKGTDPTKTRGNHTDSDKKAGRSSAYNRGRGVKSGQTENSRSRAEHGISNGDEMKTVDEKRQKAVARELRKLKKNR